ncbi:MAG TPA: hypothetical protein DDY37_05735, partial [Legionella sp.]|nr:hypothetical protein [Legionella sp.]
MIANGYGSSFCKLSKAKKAGRDVSELDDTMKGMMPLLASFHIPYIKWQNGPFDDLKMNEWRQGAALSDTEYVTVSHFLQNVGSNEAQATYPEIRSVVVNDSSGRTMALHDHLNLPHFFDVSGTTGALMQAACGLLHKAGRPDLIDSPDTALHLGMVLAGCNFYKQGFHNFYEVLPSLSWSNHHIFKTDFKVSTPIELIHDVKTTLTNCTNQSSQVYPIVGDAMHLVTEHAELHYELYKQDVRKTALSHPSPP